MTFLPDIVESPEPLPDKKGSLGIFQFPCGASESALPPSGRAQAQVLHSRLPSDSVAYSSFFEDYEEDEEEDSSDEELAESTLWELATLLHSNDLPSKNSILPQRPVSIEELEAAFGQHEDTPLWRKHSHDDIAQSPSLLWTPARQVVMRENMFRDVSLAGRRARPNRNEALPSIEIQNLWERSHSAMRDITPSGLWKGTCLHHKPSDTTITTWGPEAFELWQKTGRIPGLRN
jgi:hypothetical protein